MPRSVQSSRAGKGVRRANDRRPQARKARKPSSRSTRPRSSPTRQAKADSPRGHPPLPATVTGVLARLGRAVSAGDLPTVSLCFAYPSLLLTGADTHEFRDPLQVQAVFRETLRSHKEHGIVETHPVVEGATDLGHGIYDCTVRWPAVDAQGRRVANERAHYIIQESTVGTALIRVGVAVSKQG